MWEHLVAGVTDVCQNIGKSNIIHLFVMLAFCSKAELHHIKCKHYILNQDKFQKVIAVLLMYLL